MLFHSNFVYKTDQASHYQYTECISAAKRQNLTTKCTIPIFLFDIVNDEDEAI
jgi:hypothetical protein